jgi:hypothetical protein
MAPTGFTQPTPTDRCIPYQSRVDRFYYYINPTVTKVRPHSGPVTGGTRITIEGSGFYPELMSISSCYHGITTFPTAQKIGFVPRDPNVTNYETTVTEVVCPLTNPAAVGLKNVYFSMNSQQPAITSPIAGYKDKRSNRFVAPCCSFHRFHRSFFHLSCLLLNKTIFFPASQCFPPDSFSIPNPASTASCRLARPPTLVTTNSSQCKNPFTRLPPNQCTAMMSYAQP